MSLEGQRLQPHRYQVVPRTLCFLLREDQILLLRLALDRGPWSGKLNGVGGHIERGEDPKSAAKREILEETGYSPDALRLAGIAMIDTRTDPGIALYIFVGEVREVTPPYHNEEGTLHWIQLSELQDLELVEDLPQLIPKSLEAYRTKDPFSAFYRYDSEGNLTITFEE
jgi:8-oxo-dGTP diphosphatase